MCFRLTFLIALIYETPDQSSQLILCGGALISTNVVLTAAHCVASLRNHNLAKVRVGHANLNSNWTIDVKIKNIDVHPDFGENITIFNDLALLKLDEHVKFDDTIAPICLPKV